MTPITEAEWSEGEDLDAGWSEAVSSEGPEGEELETSEEFDALEERRTGRDPSSPKAPLRTTPPTINGLR